MQNNYGLQAAYRTSQQRQYSMHFAYQFEILWCSNSRLIAQPQVEGGWRTAQLHSPLEVGVCLLVLVELHACHSQSILDVTDHPVLYLCEVVCCLIQSLDQVSNRLMHSAVQSDDITSELLNILEGC